MLRRRVRRGRHLPQRRSCRAVVASAGHYSCSLRDGATPLAGCLHCAVTTGVQMNRHSGFRSLIPGPWLLRRAGLVRWPARRFASEQPHPTARNVLESEWIHGDDRNHIDPPADDDRLGWAELPAVRPQACAGLRGGSRVAGCVGRWPRAGVDGGRGGPGRGRIAASDTHPHPRNLGQKSAASA